MPRLFAGLEVPSQVKSVLSMLRGGLQGARWVDPPDYHITLRFIGDIGNRTARDIDGLLAEVSRRPLPLRVSGLGSFGGDSRTASSPPSSRRASCPSSSPRWTVSSVPAASRRTSAGSSRMSRWRG